MIRPTSLRVRRALRRRLRTAVTLFVMASQVAVATAAHHHGPDDSDDAISPRRIHEIACRTPNAIHWHADRMIEVEPCLACLRQHLAGVDVVPPARIAVPAARPLDPDSPASPVAGFILEASSRGPPSSI